MGRALLLLPLVTACAGAPPAPAPVTCANANLEATPITGQWWQSPSPCPGGGQLKEMVDKETTVRMCLLGGLQHGPFRMEAKGAVLGEGAYVHGEKHGPWRGFDGIAQQYVRERYDCGRALERVPDPEPDPEPQK